MTDIVERLHAIKKLPLDLQKITAEAANEIEAHRALAVAATMEIERLRAIERLREELEKIVEWYDGLEGPLGKWREIESAPNETWLLAGIIGYPHLCIMRRDHKGRWWNQDAQALTDPTHWQPLPPPPTSQKVETSLDELQRLGEEWDHSPQQDSN